MAGLTYADQEFDVRKYQGAMDLIYETQDRFITAGASPTRSGKVCAARSTAKT